MYFELCSDLSVKHFMGDVMNTDTYNGASIHASVSHTCLQSPLIISAAPLNEGMASLMVSLVNSVYGVCTKYTLEPLTVISGLSLFRLFTAAWQNSLKMSVRPFLSLIFIVRNFSNASSLA